jgi:hypothetical protein
VTKWRESGIGKHSFADDALISSGYIYLENTRNYIRNETTRVRTPVTIDFGGRRYFTLKMFQYDESGENGMLIGWYPYHWLYGLPDVVRLNLYTTDVEGFAAYRSLFLNGLFRKGCRQTSTLIGVARLALAGVPD